MMQFSIDEINAYMDEAFSLALNGLNRVHPNPKVGAIIVDSKKKVVGRGFHVICGREHAEVLAIREAGSKAKGSSIFVSLEPCSTIGQTPPCVESIYQAGIKKVYFGSIDPNPKNRQQASKWLQDRGIETRFINFENKQNKINAPYNWFHQRNQPYIQIKAGVSLDGKMVDSYGESKWITCKSSRDKVQEIRSQVNGVLIGAHTFNQDNPGLEIRKEEIENRYNPLQKWILSPSGKLNTDHNLLKRDSNGGVYIISSSDGISSLKSHVQNKNIFFYEIDPAKALFEQIFEKMWEAGCFSLLIEGGAMLLASLFDKNYFHELHLFLAPRIFSGKNTSFAGEGVLHKVSDPVQLELLEGLQIDRDMYLRYKNLKIEI